MKNETINTMKKQRTFTTIVEPTSFEVDTIKQGTFTFDEEELEGVSNEELNRYFYEVISQHYTPKKVSTFMWFEN